MHACKVICPFTIQYKYAQEKKIHIARPLLSHHDILKEERRCDSSPINTGLQGEFCPLGLIRESYSEFTIKIVICMIAYPLEALIYGSSAFEFPVLDKK